MRKERYRGKSASKGWKRPYLILSSLPLETKHDLKLKTILLKNNKIIQTNSLCLEYNLYYPTSEFCSRLFMFSTLLNILPSSLKSTHSSRLSSKDSLSVELLTERLYYSYHLCCHEKYNPYIIYLYLLKIHTEYLLSARHSMSAMYRKKNKQIPILEDLTV